MPGVPASVTTALAHIRERIDAVDGQIEPGPFAHPLGGGHLVVGGDLVKRQARPAVGKPQLIEDRFSTIWSTYLAIEEERKVLSLYTRLQGRKERIACCWNIAPVVGEIISAGN